MNGTTPRCPVAGSVPAPGVARKPWAGARWDSSGKFWPLSGSATVRKGTTGEGCLGVEGGWRWARWSPQGAAFITLVSPPAFKDNLGPGALEGCEHCCTAGRRPLRKKARWTPGEAPRGGKRRCTPEVQRRWTDKSVRTFSPSPPPAPKARAGERDPYCDPSASPARAITKETRPPALPSPRCLKTDPSAGTRRLKGAF